MAILFSMDSMFFNMDTFLLLVFSPLFFSLGAGQMLSGMTMFFLSPSGGSMLGEKIFICMSFFCVISLSGSWLPIQTFPKMIFCISFSLWGAAVFSWLATSPQSFLKHHTPKDLFFPMGPVMALIELMSTFLRPLILGLRLTANIMGGHLLTELIWEMLSSSYSVHLSLHFLSIYETFVCVIQSVIFSLLALDYYSEANNSI